MCLPEENLANIFSTSGILDTRVEVQKIIPSNSSNVGLQTSLSLSSRNHRKEKLIFKFREDRIPLRSMNPQMLGTLRELEAEGIAILERLCAKYFSKNVAVLLNMQIDLI